MARILTTDLRELREAERSYLDRLLATSPPLARLRDLATRFAAMVRGRRGDAFEAWQTDAAGSPLPTVSVKAEPR